MIRLRQIKIALKDNKEEIILKKCASKLHIKSNSIKKLNINKLSLDCRKKPNIYYIYEVDIEVENEDVILNNNKENSDIFKTPVEKYNFEISGTEKIKNRPIIVGSGPAGLFCSYILLENGYKPIIIERGEQIEKRIETVENFWNKGILNKNSNVQFGEGGAGTFSDGKLNTLVKDRYYRQKKVFQTFVECGAPNEILYLNKPHIGTDLLRNVIINLRKKIISMGGEFRYNSTLTNIIIENKKIKKIEINNNEYINTDILVLAIGHSARDTFEMLYKNNLTMLPKPFAIGIRIQHPQTMINKSQYGIENSEFLPPASYKLTYTTKEKRGVYTFCMCPGGFVVNSSSEDEKLAINGMSNHNRDSLNANSAVIVTVTPNDFGTNPLDGLKFQRDLESKAFKLGNGKIPIQLYKDFKNNVITNKLGEVNPIMKGDYTFTNIRKILPDYVSKSLIEAIEHFNTKIPSFARDDAILAAIESRTSSPIKIERNEYGISSIEGIYPCGEGAGYAGGITSAAIDGIKTAENIAKKYTNT